MKNDLYRKTMENLRNRINVKPVNIEKVHQHQAICRTNYLKIIKSKYIKAKLHY